MNLKPNKKVTVYFHYIHANIAPVSTSVQAHHYLNLQGLQLGEAINDFSPPVADIAPPDTIKAT